MFRLEAQDVEALRKSHATYLRIVALQKGENPALSWHRYRNPVRQGFNYAVVLLCNVLPPGLLKNFLYRLIGVSIGKNVSIANDAILDPIYPELIVLEDDAILGWGTKIFTHEFTHDTARFGSVIVRQGALIGEFSVVRPGVVIGRKSLVAAMSFVNKDVPDGFVEGGVPIHLIHYTKGLRAGMKQAKKRRQK